MALYKREKPVLTKDGIPFMWESGDLLTLPTNQIKVESTSNNGSTTHGYSVSAGTKLIVGDYKNNTNGTDAGLARVYNLDGSLKTSISGSDTTTGDNFGYSVSVGSLKIVSGSPGDDSSKGSAYIFDITGNQESKITASNGSVGDEFGKSVSVGCGKIVVGAPSYDTGKGGAYIYEINGTGEIFLNNGLASSAFGHSVAIGNGRIVVGSPEDSYNYSNGGSIYLYNIYGILLKKIYSPDSAIDDYFGHQVSIGSNRIVVSAYNKTVGSNASQGSVYVYDLFGNLINKLVSPDGVANDKFGWSVSVGDGRICCFTPYHNNSTGKGYIFDIDCNYLGPISASGGVQGDEFGASVSIGSGKILIGAPKYNSQSITDLGSSYILSTPRVYTLNDAVDLTKYG